MSKHKHDKQKIMQKTKTKIDDGENLPLWI
jgi:hypothetical protein